MKYFSYSLFVIYFLVFGENNCFSQQTKESYIKATIDGNTIIVKNEGFSKIYGILNKMPGFFQLSITGATIDNGKAKGVTISVISEKSFSTVKNGTQWNANNTSNDDLPIGNYYERTDNLEVAVTSEQTNQAYLKITFIDKVNRKISGEFNFTASEESGKGNLNVKVNNGIFENISF